MSVRPLLAALAVAPLTIGLLALLVPQTFFDEFPFLAAWVAELPPYNEHLTTDVGELQLAFGGLFAYAAWRPSAALAVPVCVAYAASQALHLGFHLAHLDGFSTADAIGQSAALALLSLLPLVPVALLRRSPAPPAG